ncbi:MAG TPA: glycoside hydrolase family 3 C-terminal domain-containing protein [Steroidobacteraceae bacterium]|nr:glycoside hydrolase family 3 C-terminal domain-containing protein [Steroidobacteraceae bacterium]
MKNRMRGALLATLVFSVGSHAAFGADRPWMNTSLSADERADLVIREMTLDEKVQMVHGTGWGVLKPGSEIPAGSNFGAGYVAGIDRLGIPGINLADSAVGVRMAAYQSRYATLLPSVLGAASSWNTELAELYGQVIGRELRDQGTNMSIGGGVNLTREPRNGRNFEYAGEDPILAGTFVGHLIKGVQSQQVMGDMKHYAFNDQETGRNINNVIIDERTMRETDLLAFQIAHAIGQPAGVMCSYNKVNGDYACENDYLLNQVLKGDFGFKGFVLSDWGGTHSTVKAVNNGLDMEQADFDYLGAPLKAAVEKGEVSTARLNDMVHRILRSMFAHGVIDHPPQRKVVNPFEGRDDAQRIAEESIVLLKNENVLPLSKSAHRIALIGSHADVGVLSGGGSAQVDAPGGNAINPSQGASPWGKPVYFPSSPLKQIHAAAPNAKVEFNAGDDAAAAANFARDADVAIVFVNQYMTEGWDSPTLSLPDQQDALVSAVAAANPNTIVVLETGGPVSMPWVDQVKGVLAAWYPGIGGAEALTNILFGDVNPSGRLPITFAKTENDLPSPKIQGLKPRSQSEEFDPKKKPEPFDVRYPEGLRYGYRWYESTGKQPLFAFGHGLSYTKFEYSQLQANGRDVKFTLKNAGDRAGAETAQIYVTLPASADEPYKRLVAWQKVELQPGESKQVSVTLDPAYLSVFNTKKHGWELKPGKYQVHVGGSAAKSALDGTTQIKH